MQGNSHSDTPVAPDAQTMPETPASPPSSDSSASSAAARASVQNFVAGQQGRRTRASVAGQQQAQAQQQTPAKSGKQQGQQEPDVRTPLGDAIQDSARATNDWFAQVKTPAGLLGAFILLFVCIWMLLPTASGYTRFQLLWFSIIGKTKITDTPQLSPDLQQQAVTQIGQQQQTIGQALAQQFPTGQGPSPTQVQATDQTPLSNGYQEMPIAVHQEFSFLD